MSKSDRSLLNIINYPKFQFPNIMVLLSGVFASVVILGSFIVLQARLLFALADGRAEVELIETILWKYGLICGGALVLAVLLLCFWSLILTHRMVGPFPRLKNEIEAMHENEEVHLLYIRDYDYLQEFFETINRLLIRLLRYNENYRLIESDRIEELDPGGEGSTPEE